LNGVCVFLRNLLGIDQSSQVFWTERWDIQCQAWSRVTQASAVEREYTAFLRLDAVKRLGPLVKPDADFESFVFGKSAVLDERGERLGLFLVLEFRSGLRERIVKLGPVQAEYRGDPIEYLAPAHTAPEICRNSGRTDHYADCAKGHDKAQNPSTSHPLKLPDRVYTRRNYIATPMFYARNVKELSSFYDNSHLSQIPGYRIRVRMEHLSARRHHYMTMGITKSQSRVAL
jgi:hypothetical protein